MYIIKYSLIKKYVHYTITIVILFFFFVFRTPSERMVTKSSTPSKGNNETLISPITTPSGDETELLGNDAVKTAGSSRTSSSKPPSSSRTRSSKITYTGTSPVSKNLASASNSSLKGASNSNINRSDRSVYKEEKIETGARNSSFRNIKKSPGSRTASGLSTTSSVQSRTLKSGSRTGSSGSINTLTSQDGDDLIDSESGEEQDVKFFDVQSQSSRASSKSTRSKRGSASQKKQEGGRKPYKTVDPEEIVGLFLFAVYPCTDDM